MVDTQISHTSLETAASVSDRVGGW